MKKIFIILLISNNLLAQDVLTESFGSENLETLNDAFSKKDLIKISNDSYSRVTEYLSGNFYSFENEKKIRIVC